MLVAYLGYENQKRKTEEQEGKFRSAWKFTQKIVGNCTWRYDFLLFQCDSSDDQYVWNWWSAYKKDYAHNKSENFIANLHEP